MVDEANKGNFVPDRKLQCYFKCMMVMTKTMSKDDKVQRQSFTRTVQIMLEEKYVEPVLKAIEHCGPVGE
ncbi:hypothetical protein EAI_07002 [Harpegnathos saltator]|uniref:Uncharacterized protein n=1 Tax=Harpegnathos saltator TaxID=610380 RepID=E2C4J8_HARSA|nr:hypothetical protein EAI_07002 [Harpegnathos saltator]